MTPARLHLLSRLENLPNKRKVILYQVERTRFDGTLLTVSASISGFRRIIKRPPLHKRILRRLGNWMTGNVSEIEAKALAMAFLEVYQLRERLLK